MIFDLEEVVGVGVSEGADEADGLDDVGRAQVSVSVGVIRAVHAHGFIGRDPENLSAEEDGCGGFQGTEPVLAHCKLPDSKVLGTFVKPEAQMKTLDKGGALP